MCESRRIMDSITRLTKTPRKRSRTVMGVSHVALGIKIIISWFLHVSTVASEAAAMERSMDRRAMRVSKLSNLLPINPHI